MQLPMSMLSLSLLSAAFCLGLGAPAAAQDPEPPPGGFPVKAQLDLPITYSDGYRTMLDIRYPDVAVMPPTGWPAAMVVHGGGGSRKRGWVITVAEMLASRGYVALAYDTSGNGVTVKLNPPGSRAGSLRIRDYAEIFYFAEQQLGPRMDEQRLASFGRSGGGKHTLWGASFSGRPLPVPSALVTHMPRLLAAHTDIQVLDFEADKIPQGDMLQGEWVVDTIGALGPTDPVSQMMLQGDYAGLSRYVRSDPSNHFLPLLSQSDVPLVVSYAFDDTKHQVNTNGDSFRLLKPGVPRRYTQATGGHASAENDIETALRRDFTARWFDRFLKGRNNGVDREPFAEIAVVVDDPVQYQDPQSQWRHRRTATWPIAPGQRMFLRGGGRLDAAAPAGIEGGPTIRHRVQPGYGILGFVADKGRAAAVVAKIPLVTGTFDTPVLSQPRELLGRSIVELDVVNSGATGFQLQAALIDVGPGGGERFVTCGVTALRNAVPGRHRLRIELGDVGYVIRAGHKLRLSLENLNLRRQPGNAHFHCMPEFADVDLAVQIDPAFAPRVDLPLGPARASLTPRFTRVSAAAGVSHKIHLRGESSRAGAIYQVLIGASGNAPGVNLPPHVPLNFDAVTSIGLSLVNTPMFRDFLGQLDANGDGTANLVLPAPLAGAIAGIRLQFVGVGLEPGGGYFATAPAELIIEP